MRTTLISQRMIVGAVLSALMATAIAVPVTADDGQDARDYCESVGGHAQSRQAMWNTNADQSAWADLGRTMEVCRFQADDEGRSRIYVELMTLYSEQPSLAAGAYLARVPMTDDLPGGNPATINCTDLGGSSGFGWGSGGWVATDDPDDVVVAMCVFPDLSAIDDWGIAYYSDDTVRGADLAPLFRSDTDSYPLFFGE